MGNDYYSLHFETHEPGFQSTSSILLCFIFRFQYEESKYRPYAARGCLHRAQTPVFELQFIMHDGELCHRAKYFHHIYTNAKRIYILFK